MNDHKADYRPWAIPGPKFAIGDKVIINNSIFKGLKGTIFKVSEDRSYTNADKSYIYYSVTLNDKGLPRGPYKEKDLERDISPDRIFKDLLNET